MATSPPTGSPFRSAAALFAGLLTVIVLSTATDAVFHHAQIFPAEGQPMAAKLWALALAYRVVYGMAGGFVTARIAPVAGVSHALVLGLIGLALSTLGLVATWSRGPEFGPKWYPLALVVTAVPCTWLGGVLGQRRR